MVACCVMGNTKSKLRVANRPVGRKHVAGDSAHDDDTVRGISYTTLEDEPEVGSCLDPSSEERDHCSAIADPFNNTYNPWNSSGNDNSLTVATLIIALDYCCRPKTALCC